jgi:hypothetical protein
MAACRLLYVRGRSNVTGLEEGWLEVALGAICGLGLVGGVFWFTFVRVPPRRDDGGIADRDADYFLQNDPQNIEPPSQDT